MATYTQGYQPYMPDWQPFTPDYKFLSDVLDVKTNRYNTNYKALNDVYTKVVYGDLSRSDTQEMRKQYAENLGKQLELISGMDLSLAQNVDAANQLFKPFFEEDIIVKDLTFTKQYQNEMQYANMLMNSPDAEQRKTYWQTGVKALDYQLEDFKNASPDVALTMGTPRYIGNANLYDKAINYLKESGLDVTQEYVDDTGFFIIKDRNGNLVTEQAYTMAQRALLNDPSVQQAYYADAYVRSRDFAKAGMEAGTFASVDQGQATWAKETISAFEQQLAARALKEQNKVDELKNININWDQYVKEQGIIPGSDEEKTYTQQRASYEAALQGLQITEQVLKDSQGNPDQSTQGLLNRAYNLLMGYNIQNDLGAAAVAYSRINMSRELKVNDYKKQQLQFQHDFGKIAMQHRYNLVEESIKQQNRKELEEYKYNLENPYAAQWLQLFTPPPIDTKTGTEEVLIDPATGEPIDPKDADYVNINNAKVEKLRESVTGEQVDLALNALMQLEPNANNYYVINDRIKGDLPTIKRELMKPENASTADDFYRKMANKINDGETLFKENPGFLKKNDGADYQNLYSGFEKITAKRMQLDDLVSMGNKVMLENFTKVLQTDLTKESQMVRSELRSGTPSVFSYNESNSAFNLKDEAEFIDEYVRLAENQKIKTANNSYTGWSKPTYDPYTNQVIGGTYFDKNLATTEAKKAYARQKALLNSTLNGTLETIAEEEGAKTNANVRMFQPWDPNQYMRGISPEAMTTGDALKNPFYQTVIDPITARQDINQITALTELTTQVNKTPVQNIRFLPGDIGQKEPGDVDMSNSDPTAKKIYNAWLQDMAKFRDPKASKTNMPSVTIGYAPAYGPTGKETLGKDRAAYVISFTNEWLNNLKGTTNKPGILGSDFDVENYASITVSFPQEDDINPKKAGEFNFSAVRNKVVFSPQKQYVTNIDSGGSIRVFQDPNNNFMAEVIQKQYNPQTGNFDNIAPEIFNLTQLQNQNNETIGFMDRLVSTYINGLFLTAEQNIRDQKNNKKIKANN